jgi:hypothetical protein
MTDIPIISTVGNGDLYIDFSDFDDGSTSSPQEVDSLYERDGKKISFDDKTMLYYKAMRFRKMDPIFQIDLDEDKCFKFYYQWNPYTGERLGADPYGPMCFHPDSLIKYFYENRLNNLWVEQVEQNGDNYEGYYDVAVGAGEDIYIQSRGYNPERYLFRLPIIDCYWIPCMKNEAIVTMGPVLTDDEVKQIDEIAKKYGSYYSSQFGTPRPSLYLMKQLYDKAISKKPQITNIINSLTAQQLSELYAKVNREAVDRLRSIKG